MKFLKVFSFAALAIAIGSCAPFSDSPFSDQVLHKERDLNLQAMGKVGNIESGGKIRFAIVTDPHQNYKDLDGVVSAVNGTPNIGFVANLGDITNSGYNLEYDQYMHSHLNYRRPVLSALGNHDAIGAGANIFTKLFGTSNFYFETATKRFIFFHTANLEDPGGFNAQWLLDRVNESSKSVIILSHCNLRDPERFKTADLDPIFTAIINNPKTLLLINGHNHVYGVDIESGTVLLQSPRVEDDQWLLIEITGTQLKVTRMNGEGAETFTLKN